MICEWLCGGSITFLIYIHLSRTDLSPTTSFDTKEFLAHRPKKRKNQKESERKTKNRRSVATVDVNYVNCSLLIAHHTFLLLFDWNVKFFCFFLFIFIFIIIILNAKYMYIKAFLIINIQWMCRCVSVKLKRFSRSDTMRGVRTVAVCKWITEWNPCIIQNECVSTQQWVHAVWCIFGIAHCENAMRHAKWKPNALWVMRKIFGRRAFRIWNRKWRECIASYFADILCFWLPIKIINNKRCDDCLT